MQVRKQGEEGDVQAERVGHTEPDPRPPALAREDVHEQDRAEQHEDGGEAQHGQRRVDGHEWREERGQSRPELEVRASRIRIQDRVVVPGDVEAVDESLGEYDVLDASLLGRSGKTAHAARKSASSGRRSASSRRVMRGWC